MFFRAAPKEKEARAMMKMIWNSFYSRRAIAPCVCRTHTKIDKAK